MVGIPTRAAAIASQVASPTITNSWQDGSFRIATDTRSGWGLVAVDVCLGCARVDEPACVQEIEIVSRGRSASHSMRGRCGTHAGAGGEKVARTRERPGLLDQFAVVAASLRRIASPSRSSTSSPATAR